MDERAKLAGQWQALAPAWIEATAQGRNVYRDGLLDAWMLDAAGDVAGIDVLDLGCGEGRFGRMLAGRGARVVGVDLCEDFIAYARANASPSETYRVGDAEDSDIASGSFDLVVSYLNLVDLLHFEKAVAEAYRVLRAGGRFVVCNLQPMNTAGNEWVRDEEGRKLHFKLDNYFDEGSRDFAMFGHPVTNYHRTLSTYVNTFLAAGFQLTGIREPKPSEEQVRRWPDVDDNLRLPYFIIFLLRKM